MDAYDYATAHAALLVAAQLTIGLVGAMEQRLSQTAWTAISWVLALIAFAWYGPATAGVSLAIWASIALIISATEMLQ